MKLLFAITPLLFLLLIPTANAADSYYCDCQSGSSTACVAGNDSNDGLTNLSPKKTFANANAKFSKLSAGDSIKFCRGGAFTVAERYIWVNNSCTAGVKCNVTSFDLPNQTSPQLARPIIVQNGNAHLFSLADGGNSDPDGGYVFSNLDLRCAGCLRNGGAAFFLYNDVNDVLIENISMNGFNIGVSIQGANDLNLGSDGTQDNITLNKLQFLNSIRQGIQGGANYLTISNSYFENNGEGTIFDHNIYISKGNNTIIRGNELYRSSLNLSGSCAGAPLVVHGVIDNLLIENNIVREDIGKATTSCWGIAVDNGYGGYESFTNITIRGNKVVNVGNISIGVTSCSTCTIENNVIFQQQAFGSTSIKAPSKTRGDEDAAQNNVIIRNNSIFTSSSGTGIKLGTEGVGHVITSNAIHYSGSGKFSCYNFGLAPSKYTAVDNNSCFFPNTTTAQWEEGSGTTNPLATWQTESGLGANSKNVDPKFTNPTLPLVDLSLQSTSPLINAGEPDKSSTNDYRRKTRADPDIGAFEFGTFNPPAKTKSYFN